MHAGILIERIVRQTTVLIAQLSTAAGIRAPLAKIADQVFLELSREIEAQGVTRKVAADMFGLALRTYQRKVQRLTESATQRSTTLWEAVFEHVRDNGGISRARLNRRFTSDDPEQVAAVISDLVASGLIYTSGSGSTALYRALSDDEQSAVAEAAEFEAVAGLLWQTIYRAPGQSAAELAAQLRLDPELVRRGLAQLEADGRIEADGAGGQPSYRAQSFLIPLGAEYGWEAAVSDHFMAMATAIAGKLALGAARSAANDETGGATYAFDLQAAHPFRERVRALLREERARISALWNEVHAWNLEHPIEEAQKSRVTFYFGQHVAPADESVHATAGAPEEQHA
jgi:hypothetical protein